MTAVNSPIELPRPNLGPEPWPDAPIWPWLVALVVIASLLALIVVRLKKRRKPGADVSQPDQPIAPASEPTTPSDAVREALVKAFGPSWRARTTEEIEVSPAIADRFGDEVKQKVVAYLRAVDRAKFSRDASAPPDDLDWWATRFVEEVAAGSKPISAI